MIRDNSAQEKSKRSRQIVYLLVVASIIIGIGAYYITGSAKTSLITLVSSVAILSVSYYANGKMGLAKKIKKMEDAFPDFLELMASNLRAGMTIDKALLASSREEFAPLDLEIMKLGKDIATGKNIERALKDMAERINSEKIRKTLLVIISGIKAGGNLAALLEETAIHTRERGFVEKRAASNVLMYVIFIFFALAVGAPVLFGLSAALVQIITNLLATLPPIESANIQMPFTLTQISISTTFVTYFSLVFLIMTNVLGSLVLGSVSKGEEKAGIKYIAPLIILSVSIFFIVRQVLLTYFADFLG